MKKIKKVLYVMILAVLSILFSACSKEDILGEDETSMPYSEIMDKAYTDKAEINYQGQNIYPKTVAGVIKALEANDEEALKKLLSAGLLSAEGAEAEIKMMTASFKGKVIDTTMLDTDLSSRGFAQWSKADPVACYGSDCYIYTDEETYYLKINMCAVNDADPDGKDSVGVCAIELMTLDKKYELLCEGGDADKDEYTAHYTFGGGEKKDVPVKKVGRNYCYIVSSFGNSEGYIVIDTVVGYSYNVYKLTGTTDTITEDELKSIDYKDRKKAYQTITAHQEYAIADDSVKHDHFYNLADSDKKVHVYVWDNEGDPYIGRVQIMDITKPYNDQDKEVIFDEKQK